MKTCLLANLIIVVFHLLWCYWNAALPFIDTFMGLAVSLSPGSATGMYPGSLGFFLPCTTLWLSSFSQGVLEVK